MLTPVPELTAPRPALYLPQRSTLWRAVALAVLFAAELTVLSVWLDSGSLRAQSNVIRFIHQWGAWILRVIVGFAALFGTLIWLKNKSRLAGLDADLKHLSLQKRFLAAHVLAMAVFVLLSSRLFAVSLSAAGSTLLACAWILSGLMAIVAGALAFIPAFAWRRVIEGTGPLWIYTLAAIIVACFAGNSSRELWVPVSRITFALVRLMLAPFYAHIVADPASMTLGTSRFSVEIAPECSGFEGMGLIAAFSIVWLFLFRRECRFPQALSLVPAGIILIFLLNAVRIALLIAIGDGGAQGIALGGFHSQAGWISFNVMALGLAASARNLRWISVHPYRDQAAPVLRENPVAPWVLPFVAILAAGMLTRAVSAEFEWLYPARFVVAATTLWIFRRAYASLDWKVSLAGPFAGLLVFAIWILPDVLSGSHAEPVPAALTTALPWQRFIWITVRALAAATTVPLAEELAFRGFLLRRLVSADFEAVPFNRLPWFPILVSSVLFGLLHGQRWLAGSVAGLLYAFVVRRRGHFGEAVTAHATTNVLIAGSVLLRGQWQLW